MEIIRNKIDIEKDLYKYFEEDSICFFDIETLGFSRDYHAIYLVGLVYFSKEEDSWLIDQVFINSLDQEKKLLEYLNDFIGNFQLLISYNGDSFDLPFIRARCEKYGLESKLDSIKSYDIYREIRKNGKYLGLENLKLKTVEEYLGIYREDQFTGGDCIDIYLEYLESGDKKLKDFVLMHNFEDLYYLTDILDILDHIDKKISFKIKDYKFKIDSIKIKTSSLELEIIVDRDINIAYYGDGLKIGNIDSKLLSMTIDFEKAYLDENSLGGYFNMDKLDSYLEDETDYRLPDNVLVLLVERREVMTNIRKLVKYVFENMM